MGWVVLSTGLVVFVVSVWLSAGWVVLLLAGSVELSAGTVSLVAGTVVLLSIGLVVLS